MQIPSISILEDHIIVTDDLDRNYSISKKLEPAFHKWHEELFGEGLDREDDWAAYLCASECGTEGEVDDSTLPPIEWTYALLSDAQGRCCYIPREKVDAFNRWVAAVKNGELEQHLLNGGETFEKYTGEGAEALIRFWFTKPVVN